MAKRPKHSNKDIEEAIVYAESNGWIFKKVENLLMLGEGYYVPSIQEKGIRCRFGLRQKIHLIMHNKLKN